MVCNLRSWHRLLKVLEGFSTCTERVLERSALASHRSPNLSRDQLQPFQGYDPLRDQASFSVLDECCPYPPDWRVGYLDALKMPQIRFFSLYGRHPISWYWITVSMGINGLYDEKGGWGAPPRAHPEPGSLGDTELHRVDLRDTPYPCAAVTRGVHRLGTSPSMTGRTPHRQAPPQQIAKALVRVAWLLIATQVPHPNPRHHDVSRGPDRPLGMPGVLGEDQVRAVRNNRMTSHTMRTGHCLRSLPS